MKALRLKYRFRSPFQVIFDEAQLLPEIRRSIVMMVMGNIFGNLFGVITNGSALTGYAEILGSNDFTFGVLTGIPLAASLMQIPAAILVSRTQKRKRYMMTYGVVSRALWLLVGLVPWLLPMSPDAVRLWSVIFLIGISAASGSFINVSFTPWMADLIPIRIRGRWMSLRDGMNAVGSVLIGLLTATILDNSSGYTGYTVVFIMAGVLGVLDMCCFIFVKEVNRSAPVKTNLLKIGRQIFTDAPFFRFMLFWTAWNFTANFAGPYLNRYALGEMNLTYLQVTLGGQIAAAVITVVVITRWGRLLDRYGSKPVLWLSCGIASLTPAFYLFSVPGSIWPTLLHSTIGAAFWSASNLAATNMLLSNSPDEQRPSYVAFFSSFTSLIGAFLGVLAGGAVLELLQKWLPDQSGFPFLLSDRYKIVFLIAVIARFSIVFIFVPRLADEKGFTVIQMLRDIIRINKRIRRFGRIR